MTDEEIEKRLEERAYNKKRADNGDGYWIAFKDSLSYNALDYIKRLKAEIAGLTGKAEALETDKANLERTLEEANEELKEARKETAKDILQSLFDCMDCITDEDGNCGMFVFSENILSLAKKYGVEVK